MGCARFVGRSLAVPRWVSSLGLAGIGIRMAWHGDGHERDAVRWKACVISFWPVFPLFFKFNLALNFVFGGQVSRQRQHVLYPLMEFKLKTKLVHGN